MSPTTTEDELRYVRVLAAPRELVFACMTDPGHLARFWGPVGSSTPADLITVEPRAGGSFVTVMVSDADGSRYEMRATYDEVVPPERLAWTDAASGMRTVSHFADLGDGRTEVTIVQTRVPEGFRTPEAQAGFRTSLDKLSSYVDSLLAGQAGG